MFGAPSFAQLLQDPLEVEVSLDTTLLEVLPGRFGSSLASLRVTRRLV